MRHKRAWILALANASLLLLGRSSADSGPAHMPNGSRAAAPRGLAQMCATQPVECAQFSVKRRATTQLDEAAKVRLLTAINRQVNHHVEQATDHAIFGQPEVWQRAGSGKDAVGDCEDIALEKLYQLLGASFPAQDLFLAIGYERSVGLHTVLIGRTAVGDFVLDNRSSRLTLWNRTRYSWIVHQKPGDLRSWYNVSVPQQEAPLSRMAKGELAKGAPTTG
jgi:predicted transglutaminase-like cysteine proteinase